MDETLVILALSVAGAAAQAAIAYRLYEPPPPESGDPPPTPVFETAVFTAGFLLLFVLVGGVIASIAAYAPPYGQIATFLLIPVGFYATYTAATDRTLADPASRGLAAVTGLVVALYPVVFVLI